LAARRLVSVREVDARSPHATERIKADVPIWKKARFEDGEE